jgi:hypothetical protein
LARKVTGENSRDRLEEAMAMLIQSQAGFLGPLSETERLASECFARIEADIATIICALSERSHMLERVPGAVRNKIGFETQQ